MLGGTTEMVEGGRHPGRHLVFLLFLPQRHPRVFYTMPLFFGRMPHNPESRERRCVLCVRVCVCCAHNINYSKSFMGARRDARMKTAESCLSAKKPPTFASCLPARRDAPDLSPAVPRSRPPCARVAWRGVRCSCMHNDSRHRTRTVASCISRWRGDGSGRGMVKSKWAPSAPCATTV